MDRMQRSVGRRDRATEARARDQEARWSWHIGAVAGIDIHVHVTFLILLAWVAGSHWLQRHRLADALEGAAFTLAVFGCIVLHELGHALTARRFGFLTRDITLLPIGGIARLERTPEDPRQEMRVALAGPTINLVIVAALLAFLAASDLLPPVGALVSAARPFLMRLAAVNALLAGFNLLPAFPMDGGRVLRAALARRLGFLRATEVAAHVGRTVALLFGALGLFANPVLVFIALFVWIGAARELNVVQRRAVLRDLPVARAMVTVFTTVRPEDTLGLVAERALASAQQNFPVLDQNLLVGVLSRDGLIAGLARGGRTAAVRDFMTQDFETADPREALDGTFLRLESSACPVMPVLSEGRLVGLLTLETIAELMRIHGALTASRLDSTQAPRGPAHRDRSCARASPGAGAGRRHRGDADAGDRAGRPAARE